MQTDKQICRYLGIKDISISKEIYGEAEISDRKLDKY